MRPSSICTRFQYDGLSDDPICYRLQERLVESAKTGNVEGIEEALDDGANIEAGYYSSYPPLFSAAASGQRDAVSFLLDSGADPNRVLNWGQTALTTATYYGHKDVVEELIENRADVCLTEPDDEGRIVRPLDTARRENHKEIEEILINAGARNCWWKAFLIRESYR